MHFIEQHQVTSALVAYYIFSSIVSSLPSPESTSSMFYKFFFAFLHTLAGNLMRIDSIRNFVGSKPSAS